MNHNDQDDAEYTPEQLRRIFRPQYLLRNLELIRDPGKTERFALVLHIEASDEMKRQEVYREPFLSHQIGILHSTEENLVDLIQKAKNSLPPTKEDRILRNQRKILEALGRIEQQDRS